jgi:hypothetical protein
VQSQADHPQEWLQQQVQPDNGELEKPPLSLWQHKPKALTESPPTPAMTQRETRQRIR